ncbi:MAG: TetR/AcrR family transcriptional regulator [Bifidobacterium sp.]|uniref:TetR/AcrR family transcriptional regulator n=1 Tax=Bifidobacterium fermentum TaxID=3059035 RepID=A0AB39UNM4_9BIFI
MKAVNEGTSQQSDSRRDRRGDILEIAIDSFGTYGYYGTSLQRIATGVGLTKAGVLHYVGTKEGLLSEVLDNLYDQQTAQINSTMRSQERPLIPQFLSRIVAVNATRPKLVHMFSTLSAEALNPKHPAHQYFEHRESNSVELALQVPWSVPAGVDARKLLPAAFSMMDGVQLRWLRTPGKNLVDMWSQCADVLFPLPLWDGYR